MAEGEYVLGKSEGADSRLRLQFELTRLNFQGHLLDPRIPLKPGMIVADVATGHGTLPIELAEQHPEIDFEGLDIDLTAPPPGRFLPGNVKFRHLDITAPELDEEFVERYDVVNLQYVITFVSDKSFPDVLGRLIRLLKPGGYLQWTDANTNKLSWTTASGDQNPPETVKVNELTTASLLWSGSIARNWIDGLGKEFEAAGLQHVTLDVADNRPSSWRPLFDMWILGLAEGFRNLWQLHPDRRPEISEWFAQKDKAIAEAKELQVGLNACMTRAIGQKPNT